MYKRQKQNFRSRHEVTDCVNDLFLQLMHRELGGVEYDADAALYPAAQFPEADGEAADTREKDAALGGEEKQGSAVPVKMCIRDRASYVPQSKLLKDSVIVFDGFTGFTPVQNRVIAELMKQAKEVIVTVTLGSGENPWEEIREQELFSMSKKTIQTLAKLARDVEIPIADVVEIAPKCSPRFSEKGMLQHLEKYLFRYPVCVWKPAPAEGSTQSVSAGMVVQECAETGGQEQSAAQSAAIGLPSVQLRLLEASTLREDCLLYTSRCV